MTEVVDTLALIRDRVGSHLIVDADTGYGNALNVVRTVREFERAGANAIQLEDQDFPKRCGHLDGKALIPADEMCGKIRAAVALRPSRRQGADPGGGDVRENPRRPRRTPLA
jgi:2-methylisocitrate lyase-like PEP mutase family enzyme